MKQKAELRVVVARRGRYGVIIRATLRDEDLYCGVDKEPHGELLRTSYHKSGMGHTYPLGKARVIDPPRVPLKDFKGKVRFWSSSTDLDGLDWSYRPKPNSEVRTTLTLELSSLPDLWSTDLWAIEGGRPELVAETLSSYGATHRSVFHHSLVKHTQPQLLAVAWALDQHTLDSLHGYVVKTLPLGSKVVDVVAAGDGSPIVNVQVPAEPGRKARSILIRAGLQT